jgi:dihydrofolate reductase
MRKITISTMVSLDGVMGDPQSWAMENFDESAQVDGLKRLLINDGMLLGRVTYEALSKAWSGRTGAFADRINEIPKCVFSSTLDKVHWGNAQIVRGEVISEAPSKRTVIETWSSSATVGLPRRFSEEDQWVSFA